MPHLAPMPWLLFMVSMWISLFFLMSISWWYMNKTLHPITYYSLTSSSNKWKW